MEFERFFEIGSNQMMNLGEKLGKNDRFRKRTQRRIHRIKNHSIWIKIREEIKERIR